MPRCRGFSLIEGVVAISLVGILSAFAVPRFTRLANEVRSCEVETLGAHLRNTARTAHAQYLASGSHLLTTTIEGRMVTLKNGYPDSGATGIRNAVFAADGFTVDEAGTIVTFSRVDAPSRGQCSVTYRLAETRSAATITTIDTSGC